SARRLRRSGRSASRPREVIAGMLAASQAFTDVLAVTGPRFALVTATVVAGSWWLVARQPSTSDPPPVVVAPPPIAPVPAPIAPVAKVPTRAVPCVDGEPELLARDDHPVLCTQTRCLDVDVEEGTMTLGSRPAAPRREPAIRISGDSICRGDAC